MEEIRFIHHNTFTGFSTKKVSTNNTNTKYVYYSFSDDGKIVPSEETDGTPDILYSDIVFVKDVPLFYTHGLIKQINDTYDFVQYDEFSPVSTAAFNSVQKGTLGTINGISLENDDVTIDLSLFKVVTQLPTTDILNNKIYLVPATTTAGKNMFSEYIYNDTSETA